MVIFIYGTTGELIKIAPLVNAMDTKKVILVNTVQQPLLLEKFREATSFREDDYALANGGKGGRDLQTLPDAFSWLLKMLWNVRKYQLVKNIRRISRMEPVIIVVHGDTMTTVLGALLARLCGVNFTHIEAGLRSGNWKHPFPEELDRRIVAKLAKKKDIHFPPANHAEQSLRREKVRGEIINTHANTVADSARWASSIKLKKSLDLPKNYILISVHRNEFLVQQKKVEQFCKAVSTIAKTEKVVFLDHPITKARITELGMDSLLDNNVIRKPKLDYVQMMSALGGCKGIITDSGGLQEEAYYIGKPCIVFREHTERDEGIGSNVVLSGINPKKLLSLVDDGYFEKTYQKSKRISPTKIIVDTLKDRSYL